jgi:hypothetical protein
MEDYRCEYVFKNAIANNNPPNAGNRALLTGELSVGCSRVDIAVINGTSTAYEIKTEMDSVSRLEGQLKDYRKVFDRILVMVPPHLVEKYASITPSDIGLVSVSLAGDLIPVRESASHRNEVSASVLFDCMRQAEYIEIIRSRWGQVPSVPNSELYRECKKLFCQLLPFEAHDLMANQVRLRGVSKAKTSLIDAVPKSLKLSALTLTATETEIRKLLARLSAPFSPYETNRVSLPQRKAERIARTS